MNLFKLSFILASAFPHEPVVVEAEFSHIYCLLES